MFCQVTHYNLDNEPCGVLNNVVSVNSTSLWESYFCVELPSNCRSASIEKIEAKFKKLCDVINLNSWPQSRKKEKKKKKTTKAFGDGIC